MELTRVDIPLRNLDEELGRKLIGQPPPDPKLKKWIRWIPLIDREVTDIAINQQVWKCLMEVWQANPQLPRSHIITSLVHNYVHAQAAAVRRQVDRRSDVASFASLLADIGRNPAKISRQFYVGRYQWGQQFMGDEQFSRIADPAAPDILEGRIALDDLALLEYVTNDITCWVNKHVAHLSVAPTVRVPTFEDLDTALEVIFDLFKRWNAILTGVERIEIAPIPQYDWLAVLRTPWISNTGTLGGSNTEND